jgi:hypothetical protein
MANIFKEKLNLRKITINSIIITMLCHSLCCVLLAWIVGFNVVGSALHAYEPIFIMINLVAIIGGFYFTYLHKVQKHCDHNNCHKTNKKVYWIATVISIVLMIV